MSPKKKKPGYRLSREEMSRGGKARLRTMTPEQRSECARHAAAVREEKRRARAKVEAV